MNLPELTAQMFTNKLKKTRIQTATGIDHWTTNDLIQLPKIFWEKIAEIFNQIETEGRWPHQLKEVIVCLIPKEEETTTMGVRPISLASIIYRLYAGIGLSHTKAWQQTVLPSYLYGGRAKTGALQAEWEAAIMQHICRITGS